MQQILVQAPRQIEFAAILVMQRLPIGNLKEFRGATQFLPQFTRPGKGTARLRCRQALDETQRNTQRTAKFEFLLATLKGVWQQYQLVEHLLKLCGRFGERRTGRRFPSRFAPIENRFFDDPGFRVMARKKLGLAVYY